MTEKIAGILGGMGPEATVDLMRRILRFTEARDDADHIRCIVDSNPKVPSRIRALLEGGGESPGPCLADMARRLEAWGADFLCIPCNTAHNWYREVADAVRIPVLSIIDLTVEAMAKLRPGAERAGILASPAVRLTGLYEAPCRARGMIPVYASPEQEARLLSIIKTIKTGDTGPAVTRAYEEVIADVRARGAQVLAVACTELGILRDVSYGLPVADAADALARAVVDTAKGRIPLPARRPSPS